jgi:dTDP-4-dehydrorhamnose reductase
MPPDILAWVAERKGIYHLAGKGYTSRYLWAKQILEFIPHSQKQTLPSIFPATTAEYPAAAKRPLFSALDSSKFTQTFGMAIPHWTRSLRLAMRNSNTH